MWFSVQIENDRHDVCSGDAVDQTVVGLGDQGEAVACEPLREPDLPQGLGPIELPAHDPCREAIQLVAVPRGRQSGVSNVVVEVEVGIIDPRRPAETKGDKGKSLTESRDQLQAAPHHVEDVLAVWGPALEDRDASNVHGRSRALEVQEHLVENG